MITIRKLKSLKESTALRKAALIVSSAAFNGAVFPSGYLKELVDYIAEFDAVDSEKAHSLYERVEAGEPMHILADYLTSLTSNSLADWDYVDDGGELDASVRTVKDFTLILDRIRSPYNVGAIFRSADSFGVKEIILTEGSASPEHMRAVRTSRGTVNTVSWRFMSEQEVIDVLKSSNEQIFALELGGEDIDSYKFPDTGYCVAGSEEFGISKEILSLCKDKVTIPMAGTKGSLNVSVSCGILLQKWFSAVK